MVPPKELLSSHLETPHTMLLMIGDIACTKVSWALASYGYFNGLSKRLLNVHITLIVVTWTFSFHMRL